MTLADAKEEEVAQKSHGRNHAQIRLAVVGKNGQEEDGVGMKMQRLQPEMVENLIEEIGEGRNQPGSDVAREEGEEGASLRLRHLGSKSELRLSPSLLSPAASRRVEARLFPETLGASRGSYQASDAEGLTLRGAIGRWCGMRWKQI